jgi:seryl-tRNA(Sec) selenium transferase
VVHPREEGEVVERRGMLVQAHCRAHSAAVIVSVSTVAMMAMMLMLAAAAVPVVVPLASAV